MGVVDKRTFGPFCSRNPGICRLVLMSSKANPRAVAQRSSMESFLDEYQFVRLVMSFGGLVLMVVQLSLGGWEPNAIPIAVVLLLVGGHATWCRVREIRAPKSMLALDLTLWGWVMTLIADSPAITTAAFALLVLLVVLFAEGVWSFVFLPYIALWYGLSYFGSAGSSVESWSTYSSVLFTVAGLAAVMWRIKGWLGRLDANRSQMLGTVSHELRNNLTGMIGITELVGSEDLTLAEVEELVGLAHSQAVDALEIVEDLLTASRLESAALSVEISDVDLNAEVETTVRRFAGEGMAISENLTDGLPLARGDSLRVRQVLRNLLSNAARYGGSSVGIKTLCVGDVLQVVVADDGDGVPPEDESTIFYPYKRSAATRRHASSIGLGLWICRQLAHTMGGDLEYRRVAGMTEFVFTLPARTEATPSTSSHPEEGPGRVSLTRMAAFVGRERINAEYAGLAVRRS